MFHHPHGGLFGDSFLQQTEEGWSVDWRINRAQCNTTLEGNPDVHKRLEPVDCFRSQPTHSPQLKATCSHFPLGFTKYV